MLTPNPTLLGRQSRTEGSRLRATASDVHVQEVLHSTVEFIPVILNSPHSNTNNIPALIHALFNQNRNAGKPNILIEGMKQSLFEDSSAHEDQRRAGLMRFHHQTEGVLNEKSSVLLAYLMILDGNKKSYFNPDGSIDPRKLQEQVKKYFPTDPPMLRESALHGIFQSPHGDIEFGFNLRLNKSEILGSKIYRNIHHTSKADGEMGVGYTNSHGVCAGLSTHHAIAKKDALSPENTETRDELGRKHINFLRHAMLTNGFAIRAIKNKKELNETPLKKILKLQNKVTKQTITNRFHDKKLGDASHAYFCLSQNHAAQSVVNFISEMKSKEIKSSTVMLHTSDHAMNLTIEKKQDSGVFKITFYDPNTKKGPLVVYVNPGLETAESVARKIVEMMQTSVYFSEQYSQEKSPAIQLYCYPFDQTKKGDELKITQPEIEQCYNSSSPNELGSLLFLAIRAENMDFARKLLKYDIEHEKKINLSDSKYHEDCESILLFALIKKATDIAAEIIKNYPIASIGLYNESKSDGRSALSYIVENDQLKENPLVLSALLSRMADIDMNQRLKKGSTTFLHLIISKNAQSYINWILKNPTVNPNQRDDNGKTPFGLALETTNLVAQSHLIETGRLNLSEVPYQVLIRIHHESRHLQALINSYDINAQYLEKMKTVFYSASQRYDIFLKQLSSNPEGDSKYLTRAQEKFKKVQPLIEELLATKDLSRINQLIKDIFKVPRFLNTESHFFVEKFGELLVSEIEKDPYFSQQTTLSRMSLEENPITILQTKGLFEQELIQFISDRTAS